MSARKLKQKAPASSCSLYCVRPSDEVSDENLKTYLKKHHSRVYNWRQELFGTSWASRENVHNMTIFERQGLNMAQKLLKHEYLLSPILWSGFENFPQFDPPLIFVIFSPHTKSLDKFSSTQKCVNYIQTNFATKCVNFDKTDLIA